VNHLTVTVFGAMAVALVSLDDALAQGSPASTAIDASLRAAVERKEVPGVVALIADRGHVLYQGAFGMADTATGRPLTADALFRIASMTKAITSTAAMQLVEQGRFGLDDPVAKYLPEFAGVKVFESFDAASGAYRLRPPSRPVTVRHILTHTSGLGYPFTSAIVRDFKPRPGEDYPSGRCCSIRASAGITAPAPMRSDGWSRKSPASRSKSISASASLPR